MTTVLVRLELTSLNDWVPRGLFSGWHSEHCFDLTIESLQSHGRYLYLSMVISDWLDVLKLTLWSGAIGLMFLMLVIHFTWYMSMCCYFCFQRILCPAQRQKYTRIVWVSSISGADDRMKWGSCTSYTQVQFQTGRTRNIVTRAGHSR